MIRNPIIACEVLVVWGEALYFSSLGIAACAAVFSLGTHLAVVFWEEPPYVCPICRAKREMFAEIVMELDLRST